MLQLGLFFLSFERSCQLELKAIEFIIAITAVIEVKFQIKASSSFEDSFNQGRLLTLTS